VLTQTGSRPTTAQLLLVGNNNVHQQEREYMLLITVCKRMNIRHEHPTASFIRRMYVHACPTAHAYTDIYCQNSGIFLVFLSSNKAIPLVIALGNPHYETFGRESLY